MNIIYLTIGLNVLILAALIILIVMLARKGMFKRAGRKSSHETNPYRDLKTADQGPPAPNHDNMTLCLQSLDTRNEQDARDAAERPVPSIADIPRMNDDAKTTGIFNENDRERESFGQGPGGVCHAVIQYEDNNRIALFEMYENTVLIGRDPAICDIALLGGINGKVSRCHAILRYTDNMLYISDLNSSNKTYVNNREIDGKTRITEDCTVVLANSPVQIKLIK